MKKSIILLFIGWIPCVCSAQFTLPECQAKARANYPLIAQQALITRSQEYTLANASKAWLPQLAINARVTYQSEVVKIAVDVPGVDLSNFMPVIPKGQYQATAELSQTIWDGGAVGAQRKVAKASSQIDASRVEVDLYTLNERVNNLFFGLLSLEEQVQLNALYITELEQNRERANAWITQGVATSIDADRIEVEVLAAYQQRTALLGSQEAFRTMLSMMMGEQIPADASLVAPEPIAVHTSPIARPELSLFDAQTDLNRSQLSQLDASVMPRIGAWIQGGLGNPGLNFLENKFDTYYIAGVRLWWNIGPLYTRANDKKKLAIHSDMIASQRATFLFNIELQRRQQLGQIAVIEQTLKGDEGIVRLRTRIKEATLVKVEHGVLTTTDLLRETTAQQSALRTLSLRKIELLRAQYDLKTMINNQ